MIFSPFSVLKIDLNLSLVRSSLLSHAVLETIKLAQTQHGLRHDDYMRYR